MKYSAMRISTMTVAISAIAIFVLPGNVVSAKQLKAEEISKILVGNTLEFTEQRNSNSGMPGTLHSWIYFGNTEKRRVKGDFRFVKGNGDEKVVDYDFTSKWRISKEGQYCSTSRKGKETCKTISVNGDTVTLTSTKGTQTGKFHKGNPKGL